MPLTDTAIRTRKPGPKPIRMSDGGGLYLLLQPSGGRWWRWDYRRPVTGKPNTQSLGTYPEVGLPESRALHARCGFELVGVEREVGRKFNRWLDVAVMQQCRVQAVRKNFAIETHLRTQRPAAGGQAADGVLVARRVKPRRKKNARLQQAAGVCGFVGFGQGDSG